MTNDVLQTPPRRASDSIITRSLLTRVVVAAVFVVTGTMGVYYHEMVDGEVGTIMLT